MSQRRFDDRYQLRQSASRKRRIPVWVGILLALLVSAGGVSAAVYFQNDLSTRPITVRTNSVSTAPGKIEVLTQNIAQDDTDSDNLRDWEESVWGTDKNNPDTDGDGTPDGTEVLTDRNPLISGPNDSINSHPAGTSEDSEDDPTEPYTDRFSKELFAKYISLKKDDKLVDPNEQASLVEELVKEISAKNSSAKVFTKDDLTIIPQNDRQTLQTFYDQVERILTDLAQQTDVNELAIIENGLQNNSAQGFGQLSHVETKYHNAAARLAMLPVPAEVSQIYLNVINSYEKMAVGLEGINEIFVDPLVGMSNMRMYATALQELTANSEKLDVEMNKRGVY